MWGWLHTCLMFLPSWWPLNTPCMFQPLRHFSPRVPQPQCSPPSEPCLCPLPSLWFSSQPAFFPSDTATCWYRASPQPREGLSHSPWCSPQPPFLPRTPTSSKEPQLYSALSCFVFVSPALLGELKGLHLIQFDHFAGLTAANGLLYVLGTECLWRERKRRKEGRRMEESIFPHCLLLV